MGHLCKTTLFTISFKGEGAKKILEIIDVLVEDLETNIPVFSALKNALVAVIIPLFFYDTRPAVFRKKSP